MKNTIILLLTAVLAQPAIADDVSDKIKELEQRIEKLEKATFINTDIDSVVAYWRQQGFGYKEAGDVSAYPNRRELAHTNVSRCFETFRARHPQVDLISKFATIELDSYKYDDFILWAKSNKELLIWYRVSADACYARLVDIFVD
jgi:hypothetical protein